MKLLALAALLAAGGVQAAGPVVLEPGPAPAEIGCPADALRFTRAAPRAEGPVRPRRGAAYRIAIWGDSHTAGPAFTEGLLAALGADPANVLPSFIPATLALRGVAHPLRAGCVSGSWRTTLAHQGAGATAVGLTAMLSDRADSALALDFRWPTAATRLASATLHIGTPDPARSVVVALSADGGPETLVALDAASAPTLRIQPGRPVATLRLRLVAGELAFDGIAPDYAQAAGWVLDVFSIPGATADGWRHARVRQPRFAASRREIDLAVLQYGTNDAPDARERPDEYAASLRAGLRQFRLAFPGVRCVLAGPPDRDGRIGGSAFPAVHAQVSRIQERVAREFACSFWGWQAAMGGAGSAAAGAARTPALVQADLTHLTAEGYRRSGSAFGAWLAPNLR